MSKYDKYNVSYGNSKIRNNLDLDELIMWQGKPKKSAFVINSAVSILPFVSFWAGIDLTILVTTWIMSDELVMNIVVTCFIALHMTPVWIWLFHIKKAGKVWEETEYAITNKHIIICNGVAGAKVQKINMSDVENVVYSIGRVDTWIGVGDIHISLGAGGKKHGEYDIVDIEDVAGAFNAITREMQEIKRQKEAERAARKAKKAAEVESETETALIVEKIDSNE